MAQASKGSYPRENHYDDYVMDLNQPYYEKIKQAIKKRFGVSGNGKRLLDIGCYDGSFSEIFLKKGWDVHGLEAHEQARKFAEARGIKVDQRDIESGFPYPNDYFDCVVAAEIIEHVYDTDGVLNEVNRVLKEKGLLLITIPNMVCLTNRIKVLFGKYPKFGEYQAGTSGGHIRVYTMTPLLQQLRQHGFKVLSVKGASFPFPVEKLSIKNLRRSGMTQDLSLHGFLRNMIIKLGDYFPSISGQIIVEASNEK